MYTQCDYITLSVSNKGIVPQVSAVHSFTLTNSASHTLVVANKVEKISSYLSSCQNISAFPCSRSNGLTDKKEKQTKTKSESTEVQIFFCRHKSKVFKMSTNVRQIIKLSNSRSTDR